METKWVKEDMPVYKISNSSAANVTNRELLAVILGGNHEDAFKTAQNILNRCRFQISNLLGMTIRELMQIEGVTKLKAAKIIAAFEINRRKNIETNTIIRLNNSKDIAAICREEIGHYDHECFLVLCLNRAASLIHKEILSKGSAAGTIADIKSVLKTAILYNASGIVISHNHPSGSLKPSSADNQTTKMFKQAVSFMDMNFYDHIIITKNNGYYSYSDEGEL